MSEEYVGELVFEQGTPIPSLDMNQPIVRCRDCVHRRRHWNGHAPNFTADFFCSYTGGHEVKPNGFCAWGERRDA